MTGMPQAEEDAHMPTSAWSWDPILTLGRRLLEQTEAADQCDLIAAAVAALLDCQSTVWLCRPFYPLPGQLSHPTLPGAPASEIVHQTYDTHTTTCQDSSGRLSACQASAEGVGSTEMAIPLLAGDALLGVVHLHHLPKPITEEAFEQLSSLTAHAAFAMQVTRQILLKNWRNDQLSLVRSVSAKLTRLLDLNEMCREVTRLIQETFSYYYVAIFTVPQARTELKFRASASASALGRARVPRIRIGEGLIGTVAHTGEEILAPDVHLEPNYRHFDALPETYSEFALPLKVESHVIGVLDVQSDLPDDFHENDILVLRALADTISVAIENINIYHDLQRQNEQKEIVFDVSHKLASILELDPLLDEIVTLIQRRFNFPFVHIFTVHPGRRTIIYRAGSGARSQAMLDRMISYDLDSRMGIIPWVARSGRIRVLNDVTRDPLYVPSDLPPANTRSEMAVPLIFGNEVLGVLDIQSNRINAFSAEDESLFEALAASLAISIRNASTYRSERWRRQVGDSLRDVASLLSANIELDQLLDRNLHELERNLPSEASAIWLLDDSVSADQPHLHLAAVHGVDPEKMMAAVDQASVARKWLESALTFTRPGVRTEKDPIGPLGMALGCPPTYSSLAAPLIAGEKPLGILTMAHSTAGRYGSEAMDICANFASYAAVAIQNSRLYAEAQAQAWISTVMLQVSESSQTSDTVDDLLATMVRLTPLLVGVQKSAAFLFDEPTQVFRLTHSYEMDLPAGASSLFNVQDNPAFMQLLATQAPVFIQDVKTELNLEAAALEDRRGTLVLMPLISRGALQGALLVAHLRLSEEGLQQPFDQQTLSILQGIAHQTAVAFENLRLIEARQEEGYVTAVMLQVAQAVASQNKLDDILDTIVHLMPILVGIDACMIYLWDNALDEFYPAQVYTGSHSEEELLINRTYSPGEFELLDRVFANDLSFSPLGNANLPPEEWPDLFCLTQEEFGAVAPHTTSPWLMGFPLTVKGEIYGVLLAKETRNTAAFRDRRIEILTGIAQQIAMAIQNEHLNTEMVERERMEREIQLAREIQQTFLPSRLPAPSGWELDARWQTARTVGGDFYDIFKIGKRKLGLVIADVSDKGMPAALYMTVTRTLIRASAHTLHSPAAVLERINNQLVAESHTGMYVTCIYGVLDLDTGIFTYANAGHNLPFTFHHSNGQVVPLEKGSMALAVMDGITYTDHHVEMQPGDLLLLYTDGVTEHFSPDGEAFGDDRLIDVIQQCAHNDNSSANHLLDMVNNALTIFREGAPPSDDVTMLAVHRKE